MKHAAKKPSRKFKLRSALPYWVCGLVLAAFFAAFGLRLYTWQVRDGETYLAIANATSTATVRIDAARGEILDRDGNPLVTNTTAYEIVFEAPYMTSATMNDTIHTLVELMEERGESWIDNLPIELDASGSYVFSADSESSVAYLKGKSFLNVNAYATAEQCVAQLAELYDVEPDRYSDGELLRLLSVRYNMTMETFSSAMPYTFATSVSKDTVAILSENSASLPGVTVKVTTARRYEDGDLAPHLLGAVGKLTSEEYEALQDQGYSYDDVVGKSGIESAFETTLRGVDGSKTIELDNQGNVVAETVTAEPEQGHTIYTTLDSSLQKAANASLAKNVTAAAAAGAASGSQYSGEDCVAGAAVVLDVKDFSVLAAATYPSYDLAAYVEDPDYYLELLTDETTPLFNRALNGTFTPGSVFKPVVAAAALEEGVINESSTVTCNHIYEYYAPSYRPVCMGYHGTISINTALAKSCNIFFFDVGRRLGIENMNLYCKSFGLGVATGIEIGENEGILAGPSYRAASGGTWQPGDVIQAAIGQSDNAFTPLQLATYCATIANDGVRLKTHLVDKITDYTRETVLSQTEAEVAETTGVSQSNLEIVQRGMRSVCTEGTASSYFANYGVAVAGKTGTAENPGHSDNVVFIGYAPYDDPEIAIAVVLEYGASGTYSQSVAKDIFDAYFYGTSESGDDSEAAQGITDSASGLQAGAELLP